MENLGLVDVVLDREQERRVAGELGKRALRRIVQLVVGCELAQERLQPPGLRHLGHAQEELSRVLVLGDRLERLEVLEPEAEHAS